MRPRRALAALTALGVLTAAAAACESGLPFRAPERPRQVSVAGAPRALTVRFAAAEDAIGYALYWSSAGSASVPSRVECASPPCRIEGLEPAAVYVVRVATLDRTGESDPSAPVGARTLVGDEIVLRRAWDWNAGGAASAVGAGDIDGDGDGELLVGVPEGNGAVHLFDGDPAGLPAEPSVSLGGAGGSRFGASLARAFDVNEDGFADVVIGAPGQDAENAGRLSLFRGGLGGFTGSPAWTGSTFEGGSGSGTALATGDVDGDALTDVVSTAPAYKGAQEGDPMDTPARGRVDLYFGPGPSSGALFQAAVTVLGVGTNEAFGASVALVDLDADGHDDLVVGAPFFENAPGFLEENRGRIHAYRWDEDAGTFDQPLTIEGPSGRSLFGLTVARAGDTDGDGREEILVGAPEASFTLGMALLFEGGAGDFELEEVWRLEGLASSEVLGTGVGGDFDLNADGFSDIAVGTPGTDEGGEVRIFLGAPGGLGREIVLDARDADERFGTYLAPAGDVNGDGFDDLAAIAASGRVEVVLGGRPASSPVADAGFLVQGSAGEVVRTTAASFVDDLPDVAWTCTWDWGDGSSDVIAGCEPGAAAASHVYAEPGEYDVRLRVLSTDDRLGEAITGASIR